MAQPDLYLSCLHLLSLRKEGDFDSGYDLGGIDQWLYRCEVFTNEGTIDPKSRCGPSCHQFLQKRVSVPIRTRRQAQPNLEVDATLGAERHSRSELPLEVRLGTINGHKRAIEEQIAEHLRQVRRVQGQLELVISDLRRTDWRLSHAEFELAAAQRDLECAADWASPVHGSFKSLRDLARLTGYGSKASAYLEAESSISKWKREGETLRAKRQGLEAKKCKLEEYAPTARKKALLLSELNAEFQRLVGTRLGVGIDPEPLSNISSDEFEPLFSKFDAWLHGTPLTSELEAAIDELRQYKVLPKK